MTVRVNKPSFNIREKLSELGRKFGLKGSELAAAETVQEAREIVSAGRKNLLINGDHNVDQRNGGSAITPTHNQKITDRWRCELAQSSKYTAQQSGTAPDGFRKSLKITSSSAYNPGASDYFLITQDIEGYTASRAAFGTSSAKPVTLSFWVRSSLTGTFACSIRNRAFDRTHIKEYTISSVDTWEYKTLTFPGITDGTWETGSNQGIRVHWSLGAGSDFHGAADTTLTTNDFATSSSTNVVATNGATWYMTGAQFELGRNATEFEHRSYGEELALCQRYYQKKRIGYGRVAHFRTDAILVFAADLPVELRASAGSITQNTGLNQWAYRDGVSPTISSIQSNNSSASGTTLTVLYSVGAGGDSDETCFYYGGGSILIDAEL